MIRKADSKSGGSTLLSVLFLIILVIKILQNQYHIFGVERSKREIPYRIRRTLVG